MQAEPQQCALREAERGGKDYAEKGRLGEEGG